MEYILGNVMMCRDFFDGVFWGVFRRQKIGDILRVIGGQNVKSLGNVMICRDNLKC